MYKYFIPNEPEEVQQAPSVYSQGDIVPLYDEHGEFVLCLFLVPQWIWMRETQVTHL